MPPPSIRFHPATEIVLVDAPPSLLPHASDSSASLATCSEDDDQRSTTTATKDASSRLMDPPLLSSSARHYHASSMPIYQTATFKQTSASDMGEYDYSRSGNPTRSHLEGHLAKLMGARRAFAVSSGMGALDVITRLVAAGQHVIAGDDIYGGTQRLLNYLAKHSAVTVHHVDTTNVDAIRMRLDPLKTAVVLLETPTNPLIKIADIRAIAAAVHQQCPDALVVVDNTMMSPYLQRPLALGADLVYHSGTKYLSGHHDLMAGVIGARTETLAERILFIINATGCGLAPFDCFLLMRGIKTLAVRMDRQQHNATVIARFLQEAGFRVHYPGLPSHPQYEIHQKQADGAGAVLSFETGSVAKSERVVEATRIWSISVSFGCVNSLISMPCRMSHASIPAHVRKERALPEDLIRLCVGIEDVRDLLQDLQLALVHAGFSVLSGSDGKLEATVVAEQHSLAVGLVSHHSVVE